MIIHVVYNDLNFDQRVKKEVESLRKAGYDISVIATSNADFDIRTKSYLLFMIKVILVLVKQRPKTIHAHDWYGLLPSFLYSICNRNTLIYDAHELYYKRNPNFRSKIIFFIERIGISRADIIINANEYRARIFRTVHRTDKEIKVISNKYFSSSIIKPAPEGSQIDVVYMGYMSVSRDIDIWIHAVSEIPYCVLHLIGGGPDLASFENKYKAENVKFYGKMTHEEMENIMRSMDIGIISYGSEGYNNYYCEPNKVGEYAFFGIPFLANHNFTLNAIEKKFNIGRTLKKINEYEVKTAINHIIDNYGNVQSNIAEFRTKHNWNIEKENLVKIYDSLH